MENTTTFQLTEEQLYRSMRGLDKARAKQYLDPLNAALAEFEINTPLRVAHFLGQLAHESLDLKYWTELWGPTKQQLRYEGRMDLGNVVAGDGKRFMGRGPIQTTGRANYTRVAKALQIDCVNHPELLSTPEHGFRAAALFWQDNNCNKYADADDIPGLTRVINGGQNGLADRIIRTAKAKQALGL
jgi:putative chitinase